MPSGLRHSGIPLGGLGTGSVELRSDGYFHEWQIMNNAPWGAGPAVERRRTPPTSGCRSMTAPSCSAAPPTTAAT